MLIGLSVALFSALIPVLIGTKFMEGSWINYDFPIFGKLGTPLLFDVGVYFVVIGISLSILFSLAEE